VQTGDEDSCLNVGTTRLRPDAVPLTVITVFIFPRPHADDGECVKPEFVVLLFSRCLKTALSDPRDALKVGVVFHGYRRLLLKFAPA
jgi:hypothetical protein